MADPFVPPPSDDDDLLPFLYQRSLIVCTYDEGEYKAYAVPASVLDKYGITPEHPSDFYDRVKTLNDAETVPTKAIMRDSWLKADGH